MLLPPANVVYAGRRPCLGVCLVVVLALGAAAMEEIEKWQSACFRGSPSPPPLRLACPEGHMVLPHSVLYADRLAEGLGADQCEAAADACTIEKSPSEPYSCMGQWTCSVNLPSGGVGPRMGTCGEESRAAYMRLNYTCVPEEAVYDMCGSSPPLSDTYYIRTPNYPLNYPSSTRCRLFVQATQPRMRLRVDLLNLRLEGKEAAGAAEGKNCPDWVMLHDGYHSVTYCGGHERGPEPGLFTTWVNTLNLTFVSDAKGTDKGVWLRVRSIASHGAAAAEETTRSQDESGGAMEVTSRQQTATSGPSTTTAGVKPAGVSPVGVSPAGLTTEGSQDDGQTTLDKPQNDGDLSMNVVMSVAAGLGSVLLILLIVVICLLKYRKSPHKERTARQQSWEQDCEAITYINNAVAMGTGDECDMPTAVGAMPPSPNKMLKY